MPVGSPCSSGSVLAAAHRGLGGLGLLARALHDIAVTALTAGLILFDALEAGFEQFDRRNLLGADAAAQFDGAERNQFFVGHSSPSVGRELSPSRFPGGRAR